MIIREAREKFLNNDEKIPEDGARRSSMDSAPYV